MPICCRMMAVVLLLLIIHNCAPPPPRRPPSSPEKGLRTEPRDHLSEAEVHRTLTATGMFDLKRNYNGAGYDNWFALAKNGLLVVDRNSRLIWQQSGSQYYINYQGALAYIDSLNKKTFCGFDDWRLPTLEEALSLLEPQPNESGLYIEPVFDPRQASIWTSDKKSAYEGWVLYFSNGYSYPDRLDYGGSYVRAVRRATVSGQR